MSLENFVAIADTDAADDVGTEAEFACEVDADAESETDRTSTSDLLVGVRNERRPSSIPSVDAATVTQAELRFERLAGGYRLAVNGSDALDIIGM